MVDELRRIVEESEIMREDDAKWPKKNVAGRQELEVRLGKEHISFEVSTCIPTLRTHKNAHTDGISSSCGRHN